MPDTFIAVAQARNHSIDGMGIATLRNIPHRIERSTSDACIAVVQACTQSSDDPIVPLYDGALARTILT